MGSTADSDNYYTLQTLSAFSLVRPTVLGISATIEILKQTR